MSADLHPALAEVSENLAFTYVFARAIKDGNLTHFDARKVAEKWRFALAAVLYLYQLAQTDSEFTRSLTKPETITRLERLCHEAAINTSYLTLYDPPAFHRQPTVLSRLLESLGKNLTKEDGNGKNLTKEDSALGKKSSLGKNLGKIDLTKDDTLGKIITEMISNGNSFALKRQNCGKAGCRCNAGELHGPYLWELIRDSSKSSGYRWKYRGRIGSEKYHQYCDLNQINAAEIEQLVVEGEEVVT